MAEKRAPALVISDLVAGYAGTTVIGGLTLPPLLPGELVALVGPNAVGKSTLLRAIACLMPSSGGLLHDDADLRRLTVQQRAERIGFMPQSFPGGIKLTVIDSLVATMPPSALAGMRSEGIANTAFAVLDRFAISDLAMRPLDTLSGGQRQVVNLALAVCRNPPVLLLDEPTSALDLSRQFQIMQLIRDFVREGRIGIVVLHDLALAAQWADRIAVLHHAGLQGFDIPERTITPEMLRTVYGIEARVERCSRGRLQIMTDGPAKNVGTSKITNHKDQT